MPITSQIRVEFDPLLTGLAVLVAGAVAALAAVWGADAVAVTVGEGAVAVTVVGATDVALLCGVVGP